MLIPSCGKQPAGFSEFTSGKGTTPVTDSGAATTADTDSDNAADAAADGDDAAAATTDDDKNEHEPSAVIPGNASFSSVSSSSSHNRIPVHISDTRNPTFHAIRYGPQNWHTIN